jgi:hypothetical protein
MLCRDSNHVVSHIGCLNGTVICISASNIHNPQQSVNSEHVIEHVVAVKVHTLAPWCSLDKCFCEFLSSRC